MSRLAGRDGRGCWALFEGKKVYTYIPLCWKVELRNGLVLFAGLGVFSPVDCVLPLR